MVTIAQTRLPPPKSWSEFEDICRDSFGERWSNPDLTKHGRQGQRQRGVDIYGNDHAGNRVGIQCKNTASPISPTLIAAEVAIAEEFEPPITKLYIATTYDTDASIQQHVRCLSESRVSQGKFGVEIVSWPEIVQDLAKNPALAAKHYPQHFPPSAATPTNMRRDRDVQNLTELLEVIDSPSIAEYLTYGAKYIHFSVYAHVDRILAVRASPIFAIGNQTLLASIDHLVMQWLNLQKLIDSARYNLLPNNMLAFYMPDDACQTPEETKTFEAIGAQVGALLQAVHVFTDYVQANYPDIDLSATSRKARKLYC